MMNVFEPVLEQYAIFDSYACRKNKGLKKAVKRTQYFARKHSWCVKLDIKKYFDTIDHHVLQKRLAKLTNDKAFLNLCGRVIESYTLQAGKGLPIGNLFSQHCANLYLGMLDHFVKDTLGVKGYLRYMDDFILFGASREEVKELKKTVEQFLHDVLQLTLHPIQPCNKTAGGVGFLGFRVRPGSIALDQKRKKRFIRKFCQYERRYDNGEWDIATLNGHMASLFGFTTVADAVHFRNYVIMTKGVLVEEG